MLERVMKPGLSVVVTVYNETVSVAETVDRLLRGDDGALREIILVIAANASAETMKICQDLSNRADIVRMHIQKTGPGVGRALREGMNLASHELIAIMSGDLETEPEAVNRMYVKMLETGADVVIGSRWLKGGGFRNYSRVKLVCNWLFQNVFRIIYRTRINDLSYGFKLLRSDVIRAISWESTHHTIYIETTVKPMQLGYRLEQVPTVWIGRREGKSVNGFFRNFEYVKLALRVKFWSAHQLPGVHTRADA
jgi:glycosyltransferase involved in cell wall biosynthesis